MKSEENEKKKKKRKKKKKDQKDQNREKDRGQEKDLEVKNEGITFITIAQPKRCIIHRYNRL